MMKIRVIHKFRDVLDFSRIYEVGEVLDFQKERAKRLIANEVAVLADTDASDDAEVSDTERPRRGRKPIRYDNDDA